MDEEDAAGEERVEEGGDEAEHPVAETLDGEPHNVPALAAVAVAAGLELRHGLPVRGRARPAPAVVGFILPQLPDEVR